MVGSLGGLAPRIDPDAWIAPGAVVIGDVTLGRAASVWYGAVLRADEAEIVVGAESNIQDLCCLHVDPGEPVVLEERVSLGHQAVVPPGTVIPAGVLVAGVPGRVIRELTEADRQVFADTSAGYVARARRHRAAQWGSET